MAFIILGGIALFITIVIYILDRFVFDDATCTGFSGALLLGILIFLASIMITSIVIDVKYNDLPINREYYEVIESQMYDLEFIKDNKYLILHLDDNTVSFIYIKDNYPVLNNISTEESHIYTDIFGEPGRVFITKWRPISKFVQSFSKNNYEHITYDIYLPKSETILGGDP